MTKEDFENGWNFFRELIKYKSILPEQIIDKADIFDDILAKNLNWSRKESHFFVNILIYNDIIKYNGVFLLLTEKGYKLKMDNNSPILKINFLKILPIEIGKERPEKIFYKIWDIIGEDKENNPYYVDGKMYFKTIKRYLEGLPPTYSKYTQWLHDNGESTSRFDWGKDLFCKLPQDEISKFLDSLSDTINEKFDVKDNDIINNDDDLNLNIPVEPFTLQNLLPLPNNIPMESNKKPKIFISHNTEDKFYAKALVNLLVKLGLNEKEDIFCSSYPGLGVKFGNDFIAEIKEQYERHDLILLFVHSPRYYESHVSLCEMGAAWILKKEHRSFLTSDCEFNMLDAVILPTEIAFKAGQENTYHLLNEFKEFIETKFNLEPKDFSIWETIKEDFIKESLS